MEPAWQASLDHATHAIGGSESCSREAKHDMHVDAYWYRYDSYIETIAPDFTPRNPGDGAATTHEEP